MEKKKYREFLEKAGIWLRSHKKQMVFSCLAAAALTAAAGILLCILRIAPVTYQNPGPAAEPAATAEPAVTAEPTAAAEPAVTAEPTAAAELAVTAEPTAAAELAVTAEPTAAEPAVTAEPTAAEPAVTAKPTEKESQTAQPDTAPPVQAEAADPSDSVRQTESEHEHDWIPVTVTVHREAVTHTVHHDAVTETVHHDALTHEEPVYEFRTVCNTCGEDITGRIQDHIGPVCQGSYNVLQVQTGINIVTDKEAYDEETVVQDAWDETVVDQQAYDEEITTGWKCRVCGVMKE